MSYSNQGYLTARSEDYHIDSDGEVSYTTKKSDSADNVLVSVSEEEEEETQMESEDEEKDSKAAPAPTMKGEEPCVSPPVNEEDNVNKEDNNNDTDENNNDKEDTDADEEEDIFNFDLNDIEGMSEYELIRMQRVYRNNVRLVRLGLLEPMTSTASPSSNHPNRKKRVATQVDFVRRIQPKRSVFKPTSYKDLDDPVINKRMHSIDSSDTGEEDTDSKRMDKAVYSPSGRDNKEEDDEDELESYDDDDNNKLDR
jgi:hypothetical protein